MTAQSIVEKDQAVIAYQHSYDHFADELQQLDLLIQHRVVAFRIQLQATQAAGTGQGMYISHEEVDHLLGAEWDITFDSPRLELIRREIAARQRAISERVAESMSRGGALALVQLSDRFRLSPFEVQVIVICLAPELQRKYDKLYAYLQDDMTRKRPSVDLILDLLFYTPLERWQARAALSDSTTLFRTGIIQPADDPTSPSGSSDLARSLKLDPRILDYLLGNTQVDRRLQGLMSILQGPATPLDQVLVAPAVKVHLLRLLQHRDLSEQRSIVLYLHGPAGVGKQGLALGLCGQSGYPLLIVDGAALLAADDAVETLIGLVVRESILLEAAIYIAGADLLLREDARSKALLQALARALSEHGRLVFLAGEQSWSQAGLVAGMQFHIVELPIPDVPLRVVAWQKALEYIQHPVDGAWCSELARQFRLTPGQIRAAAESAAYQQIMHGGRAAVTLTDLAAACRRQSNQKLGELAIKVEPHYGWHDLVLPADRLAHLKEICNQVTHHYQVFGAWGFAQKLAYGIGLSVLFSGPPGTGKTMAAEVIAHELQLDLYRVDLSGVVSKYIGETEKNLARIFHEAETSNAILCFDEADALFGKRTEVSDAHDRYANIETSFLLQKMEAYAGVVILTTNLRENMDEAFTRRIRFIVDFPFPDEASRKDIWQAHFPPAAPVSPEVDYTILARKFPLAGGNIKNIVLNAAFFAAADGGVIEMQHILRGIRREYEKIGKLWNEPALA